MHLVNFKSKLKKTPFAVDYSFYIFENTINNVDFKNVAKLILTKEKEILSSTVSGGDGNTGLGGNSLTSRYKYFNLLNFENKDVLLIKQNIVNNLKLLMDRLMIELPKEVFIQCWANVMRKNEKIQIHQHGVDENSFLGGHLCVQSKDTSTYYVNPFNYHAGKDKQTYESKNEVGKLSIFSSSLPHYTDTYYGEKERITIAFDLFTYKKSDNCLKLDNFN